MAFNQEHASQVKKLEQKIRLLKIELTHTKKILDYCMSKISYLAFFVYIKKLHKDKDKAINKAREAK